ncbi:tripartite tricarboxylate transporter substrate binding protein [Bradyrhizobium sp. LHD-71]|uniref:Bug family tripartite tricarboxylate transporter substrate binding protein n=1 Tax=Bradyrhizobium sp. LHD-71 TaxID=3072141 RepID=UPI0028102426|nr:tripartite tricarboxylate transporter substrate binding protein [Bradyrhizobium sp. LHD-71]MDQ8732690.1 tripartite tricarboxylate transporter substrate binding protein [Bradyrhizobium sp. LHD-71]
MKTLLSSMFAALLLAQGAPVAAQTYPDRAVRLIVPFPAGGATDVTARVFAEELTTRLKQSVIVENRAGAAGAIGIDQVAKSKPDGYTLGVSGVGPTAIFPILDPKLSYSPERDLDVIAGLSAVDLIFIARNNLPANNMKELLDTARANPGKLTYGTAGVAGPAQLQAENLAVAAGVKMLHVPFPGDTPAITAVLSGDVDVAFVGVASAVSFVTSGKLKALGVGSPTRLKALPQLATVVEQTGVKEFTGYTWNVLVVPKGTPAHVAEVLNKAVNEISAKPEIIEKLANVGLRTMPGDARSAADFVAGESARYKKIIEITGIRRE